MIGMRARLGVIGVVVLVALSAGVVALAGSGARADTGPYLIDIRIH